MSRSSFMPPNLLSDGLLLSLVVALYLSLAPSPSTAAGSLWSGPQPGRDRSSHQPSYAYSSPRRALLTAWTYTRVVPLAKAIAAGPVLDYLGQKLANGPIYLTDVIFKTNLVLAALTPLPLFLHAKFLLKDTRVALAAAALFAVLPAHITFARSDVYFMQSLFFSSLAFATLYSALSDPSRRWRLFSLVFLGPLLWSVYLVRPLNLLFHPLFIATIFVTVGPDIPIGRRIIAAVVVTIPAIMDFALNLLTGYGTQVSEGLGLRTLVQAWSMLFDLQRNTVINPRVTPPVIPVLMAIGVAALWRSGKRVIALYLLGWFVSFFVTHAYIVPYRTTMMARYHLHLLSPLVLMAAAATPTVMRFAPSARAVLVLLLLASPLLHLSFERDVRFSIQREFEFLTSLRQHIPEGCTVIDYVGPADCARGPRLPRVGAYSGPTQQSRWTTVLLAGAPRLDRADRASPRGARSTDEISRSVQDLPCVYYYEGNLCRSYAPGSAALAPACLSMHEQFDLHLVAAEEYREHVYDPADARGMCGPSAEDRYVLPTNLVTVRLYQVTHRATPNKLPQVPTP